MSYIKLQVRSGGIYIRQKKDFQPIELNLITLPEDNNQKVLPLVRDSSIKGLFSYLMGETKKINAIENSKGPSIKKLNTTLDCMVQTSALQKRTEPYITTFFERRDVHTRNFKFVPNIDLFQNNFETANPTIKLLKQPLERLFQTESLGKINKQIKESKITSKDIKYTDLKAPNCNDIPDTKLGKNIKEYFNKMYKNSKPIYQKTIALINEINSCCKKVSGFRESFEQFKESGLFSVFTTGVSSNTRHWIDKNYHIIVRGAPTYIACVDFDIYLSEKVFTESQSSNHFNWEEIIQKLRNGPNIARWGEGGIVLIDYNGLDEMGCPYDEKDQMFIEIKALRSSGIKIKKYDWEIEKEAKEKKTKIKSEKH